MKVGGWGGKKQMKKWPERPKLVFIILDLVLQFSIFNVQKFYSSKLLLWAVERLPHWTDWSRNRRTGTLHHKESWSEKKNTLFILPMASFVNISIGWLANRNFIVNDQKDVTSNAKSSVQSGVVFFLTTDASYITSLETSQITMAVALLVALPD